MTEWAGEVVDRDDLPTTLRDQLHRMSFEPLIPRGGWAFDTATQWLELTNSCVAFINDLLPALRRIDPGLSLLEEELARKMTVWWRDVGYGGLLEKETLTVSDPEQAKLIGPHLRHYGLSMAGVLRKADANKLRDRWLQAGVPIDRGKGSPFWIRGTDLLAAQAMTTLALQPASDALALYDRYSQSARWRAGPIITSYWRIQGADKPRPIRILVNGQVQETDGERRQPKIRRVQALTYCFNVRSAPLYALLKYARRIVTAPFGTGDVRVTLDQAKRWPVNAAADVKSFDESVSVELLATFRKEVLEPCLRVLTDRGICTKSEANLLLSIDETVQQLPILSPPAAISEGGRLIARIGGLRSGEKLTSEKGTLINMARCRAKLQALKRQGVTDNLGDDTIIFSSHAIQDAWIKLNPFAGFREEVAPATTFLMRAIPGGYTFIARMLASSVQKEVMNEPRSYEISALGLAARSRMLKGIEREHPFASAFLPFLSTLPGRLAISSRTAQTLGFTELERIVASQTRGSSLSSMEADELNYLTSEVAGDLGRDADARGSYITEKRKTYAQLQEWARMLTPDDADRILASKTAKEYER